MTVKEKYEALLSEIEDICHSVGRDPKRINVIAVTKYVSEETTQKALEAGVQHIGENRAEGGVEKWEALGNQGIWHFIGSLQSKKVKKVIDKFDYFHSLDRISLAEELDKRAKPGQVIRCFVQVNVSNEESKSGLSKEEVLPFIESLEKFPAIEVVGLMTMAPFYEAPELTRPVFRGLRELQELVAAKQFTHAPCLELSMGMSNDYRVAIEEGATFIRVGTALVGKEF
ncbi:YggS family pyridoxal phosphate-dependent enzyme [Alkalihalobacillus sp. 1P02AB]|uniref:YggS family pyridoxal phosphate-dependent enzyme n=1 Tax=Alkalihalobacillus sp. 1P02AB TaxID=3132260 RepID=UPI0039A43861